MDIGLAALGIGSGARPAVIRALATAAEEAGFATLWCGEHVILAEEQRSRYPYAEDGRLAVGADIDWLDPLIGLTYAAALTSRIRLGTGVLLLPEHQPVLVAKQVASLDLLSGGRCVLGIGIGWSADEFGALGVPFAGRAARTEEYVAVLRTLWESDVASHQGAHLQFAGVRSYPKPVRQRQVPVLVGGNTDAALRRTVAYGDGWYGFNLDVATATERVATLHRLCRDAGRDPASVEIVVAPFTHPVQPGDLRTLAAAGVTETVVVDSPPSDPDAVAPWIRDLAARWIG